MNVTIDRAGRLVIPKPLRERAGLQPGAKLNIEYRGGRIEIEPACQPVELVKRGSLLVATRPEGIPRLSEEEVIETIRSHRERRR